MTFSTNYKPFMTYLAPKDIVRLKRFSKANKIPMTAPEFDGTDRLTTAVTVGNTMDMKRPDTGNKTRSQAGPKRAAVKQIELPTNANITANI